LHIRYISTYISYIFYGSAKLAFVIQVNTDQKPIDQRNTELPTIAP